MKFCLNFLHPPGRWWWALCWAPVLLLAAACQSGADVPPTHIGFEDVEGWVKPTPPWLTDNPVHSGRHAYALLSTEDFGAGLTRPWGSLGRPRTLEVGAWVNLPHGRTHVALVVQVVQVVHGDEVRYYQAMPIHEVVKRYNEWQLVHATHELPADLEDNDVVKVYAWQWDVHHTLFLDDIYLKKLR